MKKIKVLLILTVIAAMFLAACQPETIVETVTETVVEEVEVEVGTKRLVLTSRMFSPPAEQTFFINEILKPFEEETGIEVIFEILDQDAMFDRVGVQQETDHVTMDIIVVHNGQFATWIDAGYMDTLNDIVATWDDRTILPAFESDTDVDGVKYFVPISADVYLLIANNKALPYLPDGADVDGLTYEEYAQWAVNVAEGEGEGKVCVTGIPQKMWVYQFGGSAMSYGGGFPDINSEAAAKAWENWVKIGAADGFMPTVLNVDNCTDPLMREEAWLSVTHNARVGQAYASNETQFVVGPAPSGPEGIGSIAGAHGFGIVKGSPNYDLAVILLEYLTRPDIQLKIGKGTGGFIPAIAEAIEYMGDEPVDEIITKALLVLENAQVSGVPASLYQDWGAVKLVFDNVFKDMVLGGGGVVDQTLLDAGAAEIEALLN